MSINIQERYISQMCNCGKTERSGVPMVCEVHPGDPVGGLTAMGKLCHVSLLLVGIVAVAYSFIWSICREY